MNVLSTIVDHIQANNIKLPAPLKAVAYGGQLVSRNFRENNQKLLGGVHYVSLWYRTFNVWYREFNDATY